MKFRITFLCAISTILVSNGCQSTTDTGQFFRESLVHIRPSWSRDGATIAFTANINNVLGIYLVDTSGAKIRLLHAGDAIGCTWSPDSKWLCFSQTGSLFKTKANGDSLSQITVSAQDYRPAWSPDGKTIAFFRTGVWTFDVQSRTVKSIYSFGNYPSWHPNGVEVVALETSSDQSTASVRYTLQAVRTDTFALLRTLYSFLSVDDCAFTAVNPGSTTLKEILFSLKPLDDYSQIWKVDLSTVQRTRLTDDGADFPSWSPDGSRIVYTRTQDGDGGLWIMNADGTGKRRLTNP